MIRNTKPLFIHWNVCNTWESVIKILPANSICRDILRWKKERNRIPAHFLVVQLLLACVAHSVLIYNVSLAFLPILMLVRVLTPLAYVMVLVDNNEKCVFTGICCVQTYIVILGFFHSSVTPGQLVLPSSYQCGDNKIISLLIFTMNAVGST